MITKIRRLGLSIGALAAVLAVAAPALAQNHGGGGHVSGGHSAGGSASGGHGYSGGHSAASGGHSSGYSGGVRAVGGGPRLAPSGHYGGGYAGGYGGGYAHGGGAYGGGWHGGNWSGGWHGGYWGGWHGGYWGGGYWNGGFWPRAYYGLGFSWFLPVLPLAYATYWWDGSPYYYANNVYYTWNPTYDGYVVTDPPPVNDGSGVAAGSAPPAPAGEQIFMYPKNGQSDAQLATDRTECQQWAASQAGNAGRGDDYRRAMIACAEARGYSAK